MNDTRRGSGQLVVGGPDVAGRLTESIVDLYARVYRDPPYCEGPDEIAQYRHRFASEQSEPGFRIVLATRPQRPEQLVGMAYGFTMPTGAWWPEAITPAAPDLLDRPVFAVLEFAVDNTARGGGLGTALMRQLLNERAEPAATLCTHPESHARGIYARWGWRPAGTAHPDGMDRLDILWRPLPQQ